MPTELKLLIVEDDPNDAELAVAELQNNGFICTWDCVETKEDYLERLDNGTYDLILSDYSMPAFDGMTALKLLQERNVDIPFILISGTVGEEVAIDSLKAGATDYVMKTRISRLPPVMKRALQEKELQQERKRAGDALRKSEALKNKMVSNIGDVIVIIDADGTNRYKSPNIEKLFGWRPEEVVGNPALDLIHPDDVEIAGQVIGRLLQSNGATESAEVRYRRKDGTYRWIGFTGTNLVNDPDIQGILGNYRDITERKIAEQELLMKVNELERFNKVVVGRELRMIELKKEINALCRELGRNEPY